MAIEPIQSFRNSPDGKRPPPLAILTQHIMMTSEDMQRLYADIMLAALLEEYRHVTEPPREPIEYSPKMARKVTRWNQATADVIEELENARTRLAEGAAFALNVDLQHQVMILMEGRPLLIAGPQLDKRKSRLEEWIIRNYCNLNDCSWINFNPAPPRPAEEEQKRRKLAKGNWVLQQGQRPAYAIGEQLLFVFDSLDLRDEKALACREATDELKRLSEAVEQAREGKRTIDWTSMAKRPPETGQPLSFGAWHNDPELTLPLLGQLTANDWQELIQWLELNRQKNNETLQIRQADALLRRP